MIQPASVVSLNGVQVKKHKLSQLRHNVCQVSLQQGKSTIKCSIQDIFHSRDKNNTEIFLQVLTENMSLYSKCCHMLSVKYTKHYCL